MTALWSVVQAETGTVNAGVTVNENGIVSAAGIGQWTNLDVIVKVEAGSFSAEKTTTITPLFPTAEQLTQTVGSQAMPSETAPELLVQDTVTINTALIQGAFASAALNVDTSATIQFDSPEISVTTSTGANNTAASFNFTVDELGTLKAGDIINATVTYKFGTAEDAPVVTKVIPFTVAIAGIAGADTLDDFSTSQYTLTP